MFCNDVLILLKINNLGGNNSIEIEQLIEKTSFNEDQKNKLKGKINPMIDPTSDSLSHSTAQQMINVLDSEKIIWLKSLIDEKIADINTIQQNLEIEYKIEKENNENKNNNVYITKSTNYPQN